MMNLTPDFHIYAHFFLGISDTNTKLQLLLEQLPSEVFTQSESKAILANNASFHLTFQGSQKVSKEPPVCLPVTISLGLCTYGHRSSMLCNPQGILVIYP